jgi:hypothetical protein
MGLLDILNKYAGTPQAQPETAAHFDEVARTVPPASLGNAITSMFKSSQTPPFGQSVSELFAGSNQQQRAGVLNQIIQSLGPAALGAGGGVLGRILGGATPAGAVPNITAEQASQLSPNDVNAVATHAEQQNPSIVERVGTFYAQHPTLVKTLGVGALAVAMSHLNRQA